MFIVITLCVADRSLCVDYTIRTFTMSKPISYNNWIPVYPMVYMMIMYSGEQTAHWERLSHHSIQGTNAKAANHKDSISTLNDQLRTN